MFNKNLLDKLLAEPLFASIGDISLDNHRNITIERLKFVIKFLEVDILEMLLDHNRFLSIMNTLHLIDTSLAIAFGVNFGLYGGSLINFSASNNNIKDNINKLNTGENIGCLAITEIAHGSNLKKLSTTATYNADTRTFCIDTPSIDSYKCWIGNAKYATHCVLLARLIFDETDYDLHPFLVDMHSPGITIIDNGLKNGLNGVGNCVIIFNNVVIPETHLLGKFGYIENNHYIIPDKYKNNNRLRFGDLLSTLSGGRLVLSSGCAAVSMHALIKTYNYGLIRKQFNFSSLKDKEETAIIRYPTYFSGILLNMVKTYFLDLIINHVSEIGMKHYSEHGVLNKDIHILTSTIKILGSELADNTLRMCRTLCAANGYLHSNDFGSKFNDIDIYKTFEGDNTLLRLEIAGYALLKFFSRNNIKDSFLSKLSYFIRQKSKDISFMVRNINIRTMQGMIEMLQHCEDYLCVEFLNKMSTSKDNFLTKWNKNLLLVISIANIHIINTYIRIVAELISDHADKYFLRYFILNCLKEQASILLRLGLLNTSNMRDIETMINNIHKSVLNSKSYGHDYFKLIFDNFFKNINPPDYPKLFTISYPGDYNWIEKHIPSKL